MADATQALAELLREDRRYKKQAYVFVFDALTYAHDVLGLGSDAPTERAGDEEGPRLRTPAAARRDAPSESGGDEGDAPERHLTGQQLCEAIRLFALEQYGYMAKCVLNEWGVHKTGDFGEIVFNLIRLGLMRKTETDRREDFNDNFDFETGLRQSFQITRQEGEQ